MLPPSPPTYRHLLAAIVAASSLLRPLRAVDVAVVASTGMIQRYARVRDKHLDAAGPPYVSKAGYNIYFDSQQPNADWWSGSYGSWEPSTFEIFQRFAKDRVVLDVGAWIGPTALWEAQVAKRVVALEPTQAAFAELQANLQVNPGIAEKLVIVNKALDGSDRTVVMTNNGDSVDRIQTSVIDVSAVTIESLAQEHQELQDTGFIKIDTEGYERVIVPSLQHFFEEKRPDVLVSLHPIWIGDAEVQGVVDKLQEIFPYLYEADMKTPFRTNRSSYVHGEHGGADVVCTWNPLL